MSPQFGLGLWNNLAVARFCKWRMANYEWRVKRYPPPAIFIIIGAAKACHLVLIGLVIYLWAVKPNLRRTRDGIVVLRMFV